MVLQLEDVTKGFGSNIILENINLKLLKGTRYGLIGANGAGKTTLLKLINKDLEPDIGQIHYSKNIKVGFLKQDSGLEHNNMIFEEMKNVFKDILELEKKLRKMLEEISVLDNNSDEFLKRSNEYTRLQNYFEVNGGYNIDVKINTVLNGMGFDKDRYNDSISTLSGGEKTRLAMAKLLLEEPNLLILDEPTNHLDFKTLSWLEGYLSEYKHTLLVVSHDRYFLDKVTNATIDLSMKKTKIYKGNYSRYLILKEEADEKHRKDYDAQQEEIAKLEDYIAKNITRASTTKMAQSRRKTLEKMERIPPPPRKDKKIRLRFKASSKPYFDVLEVDNIDISVGEHDEIKLCENISMKLKRGEKIALIGANGVGKSTFIKKIQNSTSNSIIWGEGVKIAYFEQETRDLNPNNTAIEELWSRFKALTELEIRNTLASVGIIGEEIYKKIDVLSGGEKAKIKFCILSLQPSNVIIMDEPTNHLDLNSKSVLEDALEAYDGTLLFISHDRYLLNKIPDKIIEITQTGTVEYIGKYDDYMEYKSRELEKLELAKQIKKQEELETTKTQKKAVGFKTKEQRRENAIRREKISKLEKSIEALEKSVKYIENELTKEEVYTDYKRMNELITELEQSKKQIDEYFLEWTNWQ